MIVMNTNSLHIPYIVISGVVLLAILVVFTVFTPMVSAIRAQQEQAQSLLVDLQRKEDFLQSLDQKKQQLATQKADEDKLNVILPTTDSYDDMLRVISTAATNAGNVVEKVDNRSDGAAAALNSQRSRGEKVDIPADVTPLSANVSVRGTYQQLRAFLTNLEKSPRLNDVLKVSIKRSSDQTDELSTDLLIQFYFRGIKPEPAL